MKVVFNSPLCCSGWFTFSGVTIWCNSDWTAVVQPSGFCSPLNLVWYSHLYVLITCVYLPVHQSFCGASNCSPWLCGDPYSRRCFTVLSSPHECSLKALAGPAHYGLCRHTVSSYDAKWSCAFSDAFSDILRVPRRQITTYGKHQPVCLCAIVPLRVLEPRVLLGCTGSMLSVPYGFLNIKSPPPHMHLSKWSGL